MAEDRTTITADASQYFDVLSRAGAAANRFSRTGADIGSGFIRGERVVRTATASMAQGLLTVQSAGDAAILAAQQLERVFRIGLVPTIAVAGGVAAIAFLEAEIKKTLTAYNDLRDELHRPLTAEIALSPEDIASRIEAVTKATDKLIERQNTLASKIIRGIISSVPGGAGGRDDIQEAIVAGVKRESDLRGAQADQELRISNLKRIENDEGKEAAEIAKANLQFEKDRAKLVEEFSTRGGNTFDFAKRFLAVQNNLGNAINAAFESARARFEKAYQSLQQTTKSFFTDVGSGKFVKDLDQKRLEQQQEQAGRNVVNELEDARARGISLGPNAQAILDEADRISRASGFSITDLANTDFSNMLELSKYDFSGLSALDGLTISIK